MQVNVRYFASLREALGAGEAVEVPAGSTVGAVRDALIARSDRHARALGRGRALRAALGQAMTAESAAVGEGAEVAFFPPVTGG
jgi:molybdopterin synthase sulfur carrier subunit